MLRLCSPCVGLGLVATFGSPALALPPPDEVPEEVLRTEVIVEARSPLTGEPMSPADYATLQEQLRDPNTDSTLNADLVNLVRLLQLRRIFKPILPFLE